MFFAIPANQETPKICLRKGVIGIVDPPITKQGQEDFATGKRPAVGRDRA